MTPLKSHPIIKLNDHTKLSNVVIGARTCWQSFDHGGVYLIPTDDIIEADRELLRRLLFKYRHESIFEHCVFSFELHGVPRAVLQELARHRLLSLSVKSTRYTLKELKKLPDDYFVERIDEITSIYKFQNAERFVYLTGNIDVDRAAVDAAENLRRLIASRISNDIAKFALPEAFKCDIVMTLNVRELRHVLTLRCDKSALWAFRDLAKALFAEIPAEVKFLFDDLTEPCA